MKHYPQCHDCLLSRVNLECTLSGTSTANGENIFAQAEKLLTFLESTPYTHPVVASYLHRSVYRYLSVQDPFAQLKENSNLDALNVYTHFSDQLKSFQDLVLASVIGNIFDYGVKGHEISADFQLFFEKEFKKGLYRDDTKEILPLCRKVVYFTDNCGEIIFDRALLSYLKDYGCHTTLVVRDRPILNDATMAEVSSLQLHEFVEDVYTTGSGAELGIRLDLLPVPVVQAIENCSLIISKGMANYESLREEEGLPPVAYLLAAKCQPVAEELNVPKGAKIAVLRRSR